MYLLSFSVIDGLPVSIFSTIIVLLILIILAMLISLFKYLPNKQNNKDQTLPIKNNVNTTINKDDEEERLVAMLVSSCVAKESFDKDVRIVSIEQVK